VYLFTVKEKANDENSCFVEGMTGIDDLEKILLMIY
jgi:hypothetical protein